MAIRSCCPLPVIQEAARLSASGPWEIDVLLVYVKRTSVVGERSTTALTAATATQMRSVETAFVTGVFVREQSALLRRCPFVRIAIRRRLISALTSVRLVYVDMRGHRFLARVLRLTMGIPLRWMSVTPVLVRACICQLRRGLELPAIFALTATSALTVSA